MVGKSIAVALAASAVFPVAGGAAPFTGTPNPTFTANTFRMTVLAEGGFVRHTVLSPTRFASLATSAAIPDVVARDGDLFVGATRTTKGRRVTNRYQGAPDGLSGPQDLGLRLAHFAVAEARAGKLTLTSETLAARQVLRAEIDLPANACRDLPEGTATLWLTRTSLLPKRLEIERDGEVTTFVYEFAGFNRSLSAAVLKPPALGTNPLRVNQGFLRRTPQVASGPLAFRPRLPSVLPAGFTLVTSGWARKGARTGVADRNPANNSLFTAVYRKGWERIEITQRLVHSSGTWRRDPFSESCLTMQVGRALVHNVGAKYGIGPEIASHLWWREGSILYTVSGPYGKRDLVAIANSLAPIS